MSVKDRDRLKVIVQVEAGHWGQEEAGRMLGVTQRHVRRLVTKYRREGDGAVVHKARGRRSNWRIADEVKDKAKELLRNKYADFGPLLASEQLEERDGIKASRETVRGWMKELKLWGGRRKGRPHRRRRERRACFGALVQMDTSEHDWLEGRGAQLNLVTMIDDATGWKLARFAVSDTRAANMGMIKLWIERHGRPVELYTDHAGHFRRMRAVGEKEGQTQIERALGALEIRLIVAHSPQAKGRVERSHGTDQDRLVKLMRLEGITTLEEANEFLDKKYLPKVNAKFSVAAREALDMHGSAEGYDLGAILSHQEERTVALDWTIQVDGRAWQLEAETARGMPPKAKVIVERRLDGTMQVRWGGRYLSHRLAPAAPPTKIVFEDEEVENDRLREQKKDGTKSVTPKGVGGRRGYAPPPPHPLANP